MRGREETRRERETSKNEPRKFPSRQSSRSINRKLNLRSRVNPQRPLEVQHESPIGRRELEGKQSRRSHRLKHEDHVDDSPLTWTRAPRHQLRSILELGVRPRDVPSGVEPGNEDGEKSDSGCGPENGGDVSRPSVGEGGFDAGDEFVGVDVGETDLGVGFEIGDGVGDGWERGSESFGDGEGGSTCSEGGRGGGGKRRTRSQFRRRSSFLRTLLILSSRTDSPEKLISGRGQRIPPSTSQRLIVQLRAEIP